MRLLYRLPTLVTLPLAALEVPVALTLNGQDLMNTSLPFMYYDDSAFVISRVHPLGGPAAGGTILTVYLADDRLLVDRGGGFRHGPRCRFSGGDNQTRDTAAQLNDCAGSRECGAGGPAISCPVPQWGDLHGGRHMPVIVEVTLNGQQFSNGAGKGDLQYALAANTFSYYNQAATRIETLTPLVGPTAGNTSVVIHGFALAALGDVRCRFGTLHQEMNASVSAPHSADGGVQAVYDGTGWQVVHSVHCMTPPHWAHPTAIRSRSYDIQVTLNGQDYLSLHPVALSSSAYRFTFISVDSPMGLSAKSISPQGGPPDGDTRVTVRGSGFDKSTASAPECRFGEATVNATILQGDVLHCDSPLLTMAARNYSSGVISSTSINLSVGINGQLQGFTSALSFAYHAPLRIDSIFPIGGGVEGATPLTVHGQGFGDLDGGDGLQCIFGSSDGNVSVPGTVIDGTGTTVQCATPSLADIQHVHENLSASCYSVDVRVTNNGLGGWRPSQASRTSREFRYT